MAPRKLADEICDRISTDLSLRGKPSVMDVLRTSEGHLPETARRASRP